MTTASEYEGWTNIETWNTALWLGNHSPGMEKTILLIMNGWHQNKFADNLETYIGIIWGDKTPDGHSLKPVNWVEIAESWIDAYKEKE